MNCINRTDLVYFCKKATMNIEDFREYCLSKALVTEEFPFGPEYLVYKVAGKMFALTNLEDAGLTVNLKCEPTRAENLREEFEEIKPGYHMNKKHWNTVDFEGSLSEDFIRSLIDHSYEMVVNSFSKKKRMELGLI